MAVPRIDFADVQAIVHGAEPCGDRRAGGQKLVFPCRIDGQVYALKFLLVEEETTEEQDDSEVVARARREFAIMDACHSPFLVKAGPIPLQRVQYNGQDIIYFSEEWIQGEDLARRLRTTGQFEIADIVTLGLHISTAIEELWSRNLVHRDIKPGNIMHCSVSGGYRLLDMGYAFDHADKSLSAVGSIPGTLIYLSPEQCQIQLKRSLDFRSDLFCLGVVMYECCTGTHPFYKKGMTDGQIAYSILRVDPKHPSDIRNVIPEWLDQVIMRLLAKRPHQRFRSCQQFREVLETGCDGGGRQ